MSGSNERPLYRIPQSGKIAGVCAGIADYFNFEPWLVRVLTVSIFLLGANGVVFLIYIVLWMILDIKPSVVEKKEIKKKVWQAGEPATAALKDVSSRFRQLEIRLQNLEQHVTSDTFDLKREINNL